MDLRKHTLNLREGDFDKLDRFYLHKGIKASIVVRTLVSQHVDDLERQIAEAQKGAQDE